MKFLQYVNTTPSKSFYIEKAFSCRFKIKLRGHYLSVKNFVVIKI